MRSGEKFVEFKLGNRLLWMMAFCLLLLLPAAVGSSARKAGLAVFGVPFSPLFLLLSLGLFLLLSVNGWLTLTKLRIGDGWVMIPRPWGAQRVSLKGTRIFGLRYLLLAVLVEPSGRKLWLPLPSAADSYSNEGLLCLMSLLDGGATYKGHSWDKLADGKQVCRFDPDWPLVHHVFIVLAITAFFMLMPTLLKTPIPVSWMILSLGPLMAVTYLVLAQRAVVLKKLPKNGVTFDGDSVVFCNEGDEKWRAPISSLRVETSYLWKPEMARVRIWSGEEELSVPGGEGKGSTIPLQLLWALVELGVPWTLGEELRWWEWSKV